MPQPCIFPGRLSAREPGDAKCFHAHARAFAFFGGVPRRGIYDNWKPAVDAIFTGKERRYNRRFLVMCNHYRTDPTACTPASGWEKARWRTKSATCANGCSPRRYVARIWPNSMRIWLRCCSAVGARAPPSGADRPQDHRGVGGRTCCVARDAGALRRLCRRHGAYLPDVSGELRAQPLQRGLPLCWPGCHRTRLRRACVVLMCGEEMIGEYPRFFGRGHVQYNPGTMYRRWSESPAHCANGAPFKDWNGTGCHDAFARAACPAPGRWIGSSRQCVLDAYCPLRLRCRHRGVRRGVR